MVLVPPCVWMIEMTKVRPTRPGTLALASYGSLLRKPKIGWLITAALIGLMCFALWQLVPFFDLSRPAVTGVFFKALLITSLISIIPVLLLRWLDRREPEPWFMYVLAFLWGGLIATGIASDVNDQFECVVGELPVAQICAPFVEEAAKGLGLLVLLVVLRSEFDGPRDGFIYGALIGLGFNWLESSVYITRSFAESIVPWAFGTGGSVPWTYQITSRYVLLGISGHALYTGIIGTFIGFSLLHKDRFRRMALPLAGYFLAVVSHMAWNSLGVMLTATVIRMIGEPVLGTDMIQTFDKNLAHMPIWLSWPASFVAVWIVNGISFLIVIIGLHHSGRWERIVMVEQLHDEVGSAIITAEEYTNIQEICEPPRDPVSRQIFTAQCNLAKRKFYLQQQGQSIADDPVVAVWRDTVYTLR